MLDGTKPSSVTQGSKMGSETESVNQFVTELKQGNNQDLAQVGKSNIDREL